jgi:hypothetical protein
VHRAFNAFILVLTTEDGRQADSEDGGAVRRDFPSASGSGKSKRSGLTAGLSSPAHAFF